MNINKEDYSEFIKDDRKMQFVLSLEDEPEIVSRIITILKKHLEVLKREGEIDGFSVVGNRFEINAQEMIYMRWFYTVEMFTSILLIKELIRKQIMIKEWL